MSMNYIETNRKSWNARVDCHIKSEFYGMDEFLAGKSSLNPIELSLLGEIKGKSILHLQCHFGQDTISLGRMGADVTGVDLSDKAIEKAKTIAAKINVKAEFICRDIYDLPLKPDKQYDIVFTSYGTISWLPDLDKWGKVISGFLKPDGKLVFVEFHPVVWMFDDDFRKIDYDYFNTGPIVETESGTYADREAPVTEECVTWNHSISEVLNSLIKNGLEILSFDEFDYSPYNCLKNMHEYEKGKFRINHLEKKIPMVYALVAKKHNN